MNIDKKKNKMCLYTYLFCAFLLFFCGNEFLN